MVKVNPFGLFVKLDEEIHGLAHISQLNLAMKEKINDLFNAGETRDFEIVSISPSEHRLGLKLAGDENTEKAATTPKKRASKAKAATVETPEGEEAASTEAKEEVVLA